MRKTALLLIFLAACGPKRAESPTPIRQNEISLEDIQKSGYPDAYSTIQSLRPQWLRVRGRTSFRNGSQVGIRVYLDNSLLGGLDQLRSIMVRSVASMQYLDELEASQRWGLDNGAGAILLLTRK